MHENEIIAEARQHRRELALESGFNIRELLADSARPISASAAC